MKYWSELNIDDSPFIDFPNLISYPILNVSYFQKCLKGMTFINDIAFNPDYANYLVLL